MPDYFVYENALYFTLPSSIAIVALANRVYIIKPIAHIPAETATSIKVGVYSKTSPSGVGINPGIISPIPFSIQTPTTISMQAMLNRRLLLRRDSMVRISTAVTFITIALQIHGTSAVFSPIPKNRYNAEAV